MCLYLKWFFESKVFLQNNQKSTKTINTTIYKIDRQQTLDKLRVKLRNNNRWEDGEKKVLKYVNRV